IRSRVELLLPGQARGMVQHQPAGLGLEARGRTRWRRRAYTPHQVGQVADPIVRVALVEAHGPHVTRITVVLRGGPEDLAWRVLEDRVDRGARRADCEVDQRRQLDARGQTPVTAHAGAVGDRVVLRVAGGIDGRLPGQARDVIGDRAVAVV